MEPFERAPAAASAGQKRLIILARIGVVWALVIFGRLVMLQVVKHDEYVKMASGQHEREQEIQAPRGEILDAQGRRLAMSVQLDSVSVNPRALADGGVAADILARVLHLNAKELRAKIQDFQKRNKAFMWVKRTITREESDRLRALELNWVDLLKEGKRVYPNGTLGANLIGAVDQEQSGNAGLEAGLNDDLRGRNGRVRMTTDVSRRGLDAHVEVPPVPGRTVALTIDSRLQFVTDQALAAAVTHNKCTTGSVVIMDPRNGHILAMSSYPTFDPNVAPESTKDLAHRVNQATSVPFEPGSVFKTFSWSTAYEVTRLRPSDGFSGGGGLINVFGQVIHDHHRYGALTMEDGFVLSSNVVAAQVGLAVRSQNLHTYLTNRFGFGKRTGLPLPGESPGMVRPLARWNKGSVAYVSMGHEIGTTTVQLAQAASVIANGGFFVQPKLVMWKKRPGEEPIEEVIEKPRQVIKPETAILMRKLMEQVVLRGTGKNAKMDGFTAGGKTGSAQIFDLQSRHYTHLYNASFLGFAPVMNPNVVIVVTLNGAKEFGGVLAAPVFREIAEATMRIRRVARDLPDVEPVKPSAPEPERMLADASDAPAVADRDVAEALQAAAESAANGVVVGPRVPDFKGMTLSAVLRECVHLGLELESVGRGLARGQHPAPGQLIAGGDRVRVTFAR
ncbi:MAG: penicillin-binding protein [Acidobacteriota bacterium]